MLVRPVNLNFLKFGKYWFFVQKTGRFHLNRDILKLQKELSPDYFFTLSVRVVNRFDPHQ